MEHTAGFNLLPRASAFRFILAVGVYCLSCMLFSGIRFSGIACGRQPVPFIRTFLLSFILIVVFSVLVLAGGGLPLQHLQLVARISDVYVCAGLLYGVYAAEKKLPSEQNSSHSLSILFLYSMFQTVAGLFISFSTVKTHLSSLFVKDRNEEQA